MAPTPENTAYLFAAFTVTWLLIFGYMLYLGSRIGALRDEVDTLRGELTTRAPGATSPANVPDLPGIATE